jgi:uncharacterized protein YidB (DUF937 family)
MTALLALLAVAGYQNRDKIADMLRGASGARPGGQQPGDGDGGLGGLLGGQTGGSGGLGDILGKLGGSSGQGGGMGGLGGLLGGAGAGGLGGMLGGGLNDLLDNFRQNGQGDVADSWVSTGPNRDIAPDQLERAIGPDVLATLAEQTGMSREEILGRLSKDLPDTIDKATPEGRLPSFGGPTAM